MRPSLLLLAVAAATVGFAPAPFPKSRAPQDSSDLGKMQGTWELVSRSRGASTVRVQHTLVKINGTRCDFFVRGELSTTYEIKLDPTATPRTIDLEDLHRGDHDTDMPGIYGFEGNNLRICYSFAGGRRPANFEDSRSMTFQTITLRRVSR